jgi:endonuclease III
MAKKLSFPRVVAQLEKFYGKPSPPPVTDPFEQVLWEIVAYLADDEKRKRVFAELKKTVGTKPSDILKATPESLFAVTRMGGMVPQERADRLRRAAEIVQVLLKGKLKENLQQSPAQAKKTLKRFPQIGEPGAEKILMFAGIYPMFGLESNGLRVLQRLGFAPELKGYSASYRAMQEAIAEQLPQGCTSLTVAHQLLRQHGQELCKRSRPLCEQCPLREGCAFAGTA